MKLVGVVKVIFVDGAKCVIATYCVKQIICKV